MNLGALLKLAKGGLGGEEMGELLRGLGWKIKLKELPAETRQAAFQKTAHAAVLDGSKVLSLSGTDQAGNRVEALFVVAPANNLEKIA